MDDPILELYHQLLSFDMLDDKYSADYETFVSDMGEPGTRKALYDYLAQEGKGKIEVDIEYTEFDRRFAPSPALLEKAKKKSPVLPDSSDGSGDIQVNAPARTAGFSIFDAATRLRPADPMATGILTGEEDPLEYGNTLRKSLEKDYDAKEARANKWPMWRGERDLETIALFAKEARTQLEEADSIIGNAYGSDWKERLKNAGEIQAAGIQNAQEVAYLRETQAELAGLAQEDAFKRYQAAANAMKRAEQRFDEYGKTNPEWARLMAKKQYAQATADNSAPWWQSTESEGLQSWGWLGRKTRQVVGGILSLPRTLSGPIAGGGLSTIGIMTGNPLLATQGSKLAKETFAYRWANDLGDWADQYVEEAALTMPAPSQYNRPMFEKVVHFQGLEVVVDDKGLPQTAYQPSTGAAVELDKETARNFVNSGVAAKAELKFTGYGNAGYKLADIVADLYLMRAAGKGSSIGGTVTAFTLNHQDLYSTAIKDLKYSGDDAALFALVAGGIEAVIEASVGKIETHGVRLAAARQVGLQEAKAVVGKLAPYDVAKVYVTAFGREMVLENVEELLQMGSESGTKMLFNAMTGGTLDTSIKPEEVAETMILTTLVTGTAGGADIAKNGKSRFYEMALNMAIQNPQALDASLAILVKDGTLTQEQADAQVGRIEQLANISQALPPAATSAQRAQVVILEDRKMAVRYILAANPSTAAQELLKKTVKEIDGQIQQVLKAAAEGGGGAQAAEPNAVVLDETPTPIAAEPQDQTTATPVLSPTDMPAPGNALTTPEISLNPNTDALLLTDEQVTQEAQQQQTEQLTETLLDNMPTTDYLSGRRVGDNNKVSLDVNTTMGELEALRGNNTDAETNIASELDALKTQLEQASGGAAQEIDRQIRLLEAQQQRQNDRDTTIRETIVDDLVNTSLGVMLPSERSTVLSSPGALTQLRSYATDRMMDFDSSVRVLDAGRAIADEYRYGVRDTPSGNRLLDNFEVSSLDDHIALAFSEGMRVRLEDTGDVTDMATLPGMRLQYTSRNGVGLDMMADTIRRNMGMDDFADMRSVDIQNAILEFMHRNPTGPAAHIKSEKARRLQQEEEALMGVEAPIVQAVSDIQGQVTPQQETELEAFFAAYTDENGLNAEQLLDDWENFDPFESPDSPLAQLSYETYALLDEKINELKGLDAPATVGAGAIPEEVNRTAESTETSGGQKPTPSNPDFTTAQGAQDALAIAATTPFLAEHEQAVQQALDATPLPTEVDAYLVRELVLEGHLTTQEGILAMAGLNGDERGAEALAKANSLIEKLREVGKAKVNEGIVGWLQEGQGGEMDLIISHWLPAADLQAIGATFDPIRNAWIAPVANKAEFEALLSKQNGAIPKEKSEIIASPQLGGMEKMGLLNPGALRHRMKTKRRLAAARTLDDQLAILENEFAIDRTKDRRAVRNMVNRLRKAFPNITIITDPIQIDSVKKTSNITGNVLGFTKNGIVYIDPRVARANTPMHEFGHLWNSWLKKNRPRLYQEGIELARNSELYEVVAQDETYQSLSEEEIAEEALAAAIGQRGAVFGNTILVLQFKDLMARMWRGVKEALGFDVRYKSLVEFADAQVAQMLKGGLRESSSQMAAIEATNQTFRAQYGGREEAARRLDRAFEMEARGMTTEQIAYATNFSRRPNGQWNLDLRHPYAFRADNWTVGNTGVIGDVLAGGDLFANFPDVANIPLEIIQGATHFKDGTLFLSANANAANPDLSIALASAISSTLPLSGVYTNVLLTQKESSALNYTARTGMQGPADQKGVHEVAPSIEEKLLGMPPTIRAQAGGDAVNIAARIAAVEQIIENEIRREGMRDVTNKINKIVERTGLDEGRVARIWEAQAKKVGNGKIMLTNKPASTEQYKTELERIIAESRRQGRVLAKEYLMVGGLLPDGIRKLDEERLNNIARHMKEAQILLTNLESAMKTYYGKGLVDAHWETVNNVLTGNGDYSVLPTEIRDAAIAVRQKLDILSEQLVRSGVMKGDIILTVLNNAGVAVSRESLEDYDGVNVLEALGKLPFERSVAEEQAIDNLMKSRVRVLGNYMYRSYRTHDDKAGWAMKVSPRVVEEAREFLRRNIQEKINEMLDLRDTRLDGIKDEIRQLQEQIEQQKRLLDERIQQQQEKVNRLAKNKNTQATVWFENAQKKLEALKVEQRDANTAMYAEVEALLSLTETDMGALEASTRRIIGYRQKIRDLYQKQDEVAALKEEEIAAEMDRLNSVDAIIEEELLRGIEDDPGSLLSKGKLGSKDKKSLTAREVIAPEIRALKGEYTDPRINFAKSVFQNATLLENQRFVEAMKRDFAGIYFIPPTEFREGWLPISAEGSASLEPLAGWKAPREVVRAMNKYFQSQSLGRSALGQIMEGLLSIQSAVKYGKTLLSPVTHARNVTSNLMFVVANGWNPYVENLGATRRSAFEGLLNEEEEKYVLRLTELGMMGSGASIGAIRQTLRDLNLSDPDKYIRDRIMKPITSAQKGLEALYQLEDDIFRVIGFENEKGRYAKRWYGKNFDDLTLTQQQAVEERAAEIVKAVLPTFSKVPQIMKEINRIPYVGTFVFFVSESYRVSYNQWMLAFQEMNDPRTRSLGIGRAIGAGFAQAGLTAMLSVINQFVHGIGYEEEKEARRLMLPWQKDAPILYLEQQRGKELAFINLGYTDPYSAMKRPIYSFVYGEGSVGQRLAGAAYDFIEPFASPELTFWTFTQLAVNHDTEKDRKIYSPRLGMLGDKSSYRFAARQLQPGFVKFFVDMYMAYTQKSVMGKTPKKPIDVWMGMTGLQVERMEIPKAVNGAITKLKKQKDYAREIFLDSKWIYERAQDEQGLKVLFESATNEYNEVMKEARAIRESALALGVSPAQFEQLLKDRNFNKTEITAIQTGIKIIPIFEGFNKKTKQKKK